MSDDKIVFVNQRPVLEVLQKLVDADGTLQLDKPMTEALLAFVTKTYELVELVGQTGDKWKR